MGNSEKRSGRGKEGVGVNRVDYDTWARGKIAGIGKNGWEGGWGLTGL